MSAGHRLLAAEHEQHALTVKLDVNWQTGFLLKKREDMLGLTSYN